jgi:hypothetical protein
MRAESPQESLLSDFFGHPPHGTIAQAPGPAAPLNACVFARMMSIEPAQHHPEPLEQSREES